MRLITERCSFPTHSKSGSWEAVFKVRHERPRSEWRNSGCAGGTFSGREERSARSEAGAGEFGYALLLLMMMITLLLVSLAVALPDIRTESQREKEAELVFRGEQYARAVYLFHQKFQRYPASVKELLQTNGMRFLRQAYKDPMTRSGRWRFVHANGQGVLIDSETAKGLPGMPGSGVQATGGSMEDQEEQQKKAEAEKMKRIAKACSADSGGGSGSPFGSGTVGAVIVGVASCSTKASIRVWNDKDHYEDWEFLGVAQGGAIPGVTGVPGQSTTAPPGSGPVGSPLSSPGNTGPASPQAPGTQPIVAPPEQQPTETPGESAQPTDENPPPDDNPPQP